ncbi:MAG: DciA family protein [Acetobacteraceae bacterium]|nr:DciA family protein [Acetobacteraceae bacterium]
MAAEGKGPKDTQPGMATEARHVYGPRPLSTLVPGLTRPAFRRRSPAGAQIMADWEAIVGPALATMTMPRRLTAGTLTLACAGPIALELQHMANELIGRINVHMGVQTVKALRFEQAVLESHPVAPPAPLPPGVAQAADAAVSELPEGELRAALASLGRAVLADRPFSNKPSTTRRSKR